MFEIREGMVHWTTLRPVDPGDDYAPVALIDAAGARWRRAYQGDVSLEHPPAEFALLREWLHMNLHKRSAWPRCRLGSSLVIPMFAVHTINNEIGEFFAALDEPPSAARTLDALAWLLATDHEGVLFAGR